MDDNEIEEMVRKFSDRDSDDDLDAPLTPEEQAELARREAVEEALLEAEEVAEAQGFLDLSKALARLSLLWELGQEGRAVELLDRVRDKVLAALRGERK